MKPKRAAPSVADKLASGEQRHQDDPQRASVIACARRFKSSWVELAAELSRIKREHAWQRWGFASLEDYARIELHLRAETVEKLTGSFSFLQRRAPHVLANMDPHTKMPSYQAVDWLRRAHESDLPDDTKEDMWRMVVDEGAPMHRIPREVREWVTPIDPDVRTRRAVAGLRNVATRLSELLAEAADDAQVPPLVREALTKNLAALLRALERAEAASAA
jgi:hypothetical protein